MRQRAIKSIGAALLLAMLIGGSWCGYVWWNYPAVPDTRTTQLDDLLAFMASDEFNRMFASHRKRFAMEVAERMREKSFGQLLAMLVQHDPSREKRIGNLRNTPDRHEIFAAYTRVFLDKYFEEPPEKQKIYMTSFALLQQTEIAKHPERFGLPTTEQLKGDMNRFFADQPPRTQAQMGQFLLDLKRQRDVLGLKDPF